MEPRSLDRVYVQRKPRRIPWVLIGVVAAVVIGAGVWLGPGLVRTWTGVRHQADVQGRANAILERARKAGDPEVAALLVAELRDFEEPPEGLAEVQRLATEIRPLAAVPTPIRGGVRRLAFSPDGRRFVAVGGDGTVVVMDADPMTGRGQRVVLASQGSEVLAAAFDAEGRFVALGSADGTARIHRADVEGPSIDLAGNGGAVFALAFSPDSRRLLVGSADGTARVWKLDGSRDSVVLRGHDAAVRSVAFSPDGFRVVTGSADGTARVWDSGGGGEAVVLAGHRGTVWHVAFEEESERVLTVDDDGILRWWQAGALPVVFDDHKGAVESAVFDPSGQYVLSSSNDGTARLHRADGTGEVLVYRDKASKSPLRGAIFSPDGTRVMTIGPTKVLVWDSTQDPSLVIEDRNQSEVLGAAFSPDGTRIVTAHRDGAARVWEAWTKVQKPRVLAKHGGPVSAAAWRPDGRELMTASIDVVRRWPRDGFEQLLGTIRGSQGRLARVAWSPDGRKLLLAQVHRLAEVWTADGQRVLGRCEHDGDIVDAAWSPDGRWVATASEDKTARVWPALEEGPARVLAGHTAGLTRVAWSPDSKLVATAAADGTARVWPADGSAPPRVLRGHFGRLIDVAFSADGQRVLTAGLDGSIRVWSLHTTGRLLEEVHEPSWRRLLAVSANSKRLLVEQTDGVVVLTPGTEEETVEVPIAGDELAATALTASGRRAMSAAADGTVRVWKADETSEPLVLRGHRGAVRQAVWGPGGERVFTAGEDLTVRAWQLPGPASDDPLSQRRVRSDVLGGEPRPGHCADVAGGRGWVAFADQGRRVEVWDVGARKRIAVLEGHEDAVWSVRFSPDGQRLATASKDGTARIWPAAGGAAKVLSGHRGPVRSAEWGPGGIVVLTASDDGTARVWPVGGGAPLVLEGPPGPVWSATFTPGGKALTAHDDGSVYLWTLDSGYRQVLGSPLVLTGPRSAALSLATVDDELVLAAARDGSAQLWNLTDGNHVDTLFHAGLRGAISDASHIVTFSADGSVRLWPRHELGSEGLRWPVGGLMEPQILRGHDGGVWSAAFTRENGEWRLITISDDGTARSWPLHSPGPPLILAGGPSPMRCLAVDPESEIRVLVAADGRYVLSQGGEEVESGRSVKRDDLIPSCLVASADGRDVSAVAVDGTVRVLPANGAGVSHPGPRRACPDPLTSPDGTRKAEIGTVGISIQDLDGGAAVLLETVEEVRALAWSPDGTRVAAALADGTARVWRADGRGDPVILPGHGAALESVAWSGNGERLVTTSDDGTARVWRVGWKSLLTYLDQSLRPCLSVEQRVDLLDEDRDDAVDAYRACERRKGRVPAD